MNKTELEKYKAVLEAKRDELSAGLRNRDDIAIEKTPDALDEVQLAGERELAIRNLDRESNLLRNVKGALIRVADGSYGICMHCEEEIKPKRLGCGAVDQVLHSLPGSRRSPRIRSRRQRHARRNARQRGVTRVLELAHSGRETVLAPFVFLLGLRSPAQHTVRQTSHFRSLLVGEGVRRFTQSDRLIRFDLR